MIEHVVVAVSGADADRAAALADATADLAGPSHATVHLVHVMGVDEFDRIIERLGYDSMAPPDPETVSKRFQTVRAVAGHLVDPRRVSGFPVDVRGLVADEEGPGIVDLAAELGADRIVIGGQERSPSGKALFGSASQHVLLNADCPVILVHPEHAAVDADRSREDAFDAISAGDELPERSWTVDP